MSKKENINPWQTLKKTSIYENPWIKVSHNDVLNPAGGEGIYGVVHFKNLAIGILPLDENNNTWLVGQYRYTLEEYSWEIPEGGCLITQEDPLEAAQRELAEETGLSAKKWTKISDFNTSNSVTDEKAIAFLAEDLSEGTATPEDTEDLALKKLPFEEAYQMALDGRIKDALSIVTIFQAAHFIKNRK